MPAAQNGFLRSSAKLILFVSWQNLQGDIYSFMYITWLKTQNVFKSLTSLSSGEAQKLHTGASRVCVPDFAAV